MFENLHHIAIIASNYEISKKFYVEKLGAEIIAETYRTERDSYKLDLKLAGAQIELFSFPNPPARVSNPEATGLRHIAFAVTSVKKVCEELNEQGITTEPIRVDALTNKQFTFFKDPDGLPIEVYEA